MSAVVSFPGAWVPPEGARAVPEGWSAQLRRLDFFDLVQLLLLARESRAVWVRSGEGVGLLVFREGQLVHVSTEHAQGEQAFLQIAGWHTGVFEDLTSEDLGRFDDNLTVATPQLLLEAAQRRDEGAATAAERARWAPTATLACAGQPESTAEPTGDETSAARARLDELVADDEMIAHAALVRPEAPASADLPSWLGLLWPFLAHALRHYPRPGPVRVLIEDATGAVVLTEVSRGRMLAITGAPGVRVGALACHSVVLARALAAADTRSG